MLMSLVWELSVLPGHWPPSWLQSCCTQLLEDPPRKAPLHGVSFCPECSWLLGRPATGRLCPLPKANSSGSEGHPLAAWCCHVTRYWGTALFSS